MRVLWMAPDVVPFPKGAANRIEATVRALASLGAEVTLLTPRGSEGLSGVRHVGIDVGTGNFLDRMLAFRRAVVPFAREAGWDVVWFRSPWEGVAAVREAPPGAHLVYEAHGFPSIELPSHFPTLRGHQGLLDKLQDDEALVLRAARLVITPSMTGRTGLRARGVASERVAVVPNAVDLERFASSPPPARGPALRLAYLGTLAPWQGLATLFEALALLRGRLEVRLTLAGTRKGPWARDLRALASGLRIRGMLSVVGPMDPKEVPALLADHDAGVAPLPDDPRNSVQGCCPIKILEYMAAGRPVLSTRVRPVEEILRHGDTGWLVRPGSAHALAQGIGWMAAHPEEAAAMGLRARTEIEARWTSQVFREGIGRVLARLQPGAP